MTDAFKADLTKLKKNLPQYLTSVDLDSSGKFLTVAFAQHPGSFEIDLPDGFHAAYPNAVATFGALCLHPGTVAALVSQVQEALESPASFTQQWSEGRQMSEQMRALSTMEMAADDVAPMHPALLTDIAAFKKYFGPSTCACVDLGGPMLQVEVTCLVSLQSVLTMPAPHLGVDHTEPLQIKFRFHRQHYLDPAGPGGIVEVGQSQHYRTGSKRGLVGQLERILTNFLKIRVGGASLGLGAHEDPVACLVQLGFEEHWAQRAIQRLQGSPTASVTEIVESACQLLTASELEEGCMSTNEVSVQPTASIATKKRFPVKNDEVGFLVQAAQYALQRVPSVTEFCVICDRPHLFGAGMMLRPSVCSRHNCVFSFQTFSVGADAASEIATELGVIDLLWTICIAAARHNRWEQILNPYPTLFDPSTKNHSPVVFPEKKNIELVRAIFNKFPPLMELSQVDDAGELRQRLESGHPLGYPLLQWVLQNNRCVIRKMPPEKQIPFMGTPHQYYFASAAPELEARFTAMKEAHGAEWAFHGSRAENWHSILHNGLKNASGTALQLNGQAYGSGIYVSPHASVSFQYSQINKSVSAGKEPTNPVEAQFIDPAAVLCIAIVEIVKKDIKKSGNIWVMPHNDCVMTRFLLVYTRGFSAGAQAMLDKEENIKILNNIVESMGGRGV